jgi:hypothetical protein
VPEGFYHIRTWGNAIVQNPTGALLPPPTRFQPLFDTVWFITPNVYNVITPAPDRVGGLINQVVVDLENLNQITVNGVAQELEVPMFIQDGRTMAPLGLIGDALGIPRSQMMWDSHARTATIMWNNTTSQFRVGSTTFTLNGASITMTGIRNGVEVPVEMQIVEGRTFIPIFFVAMALGIDHEWVDDTTVLFNPSIN